MKYLFVLILVNFTISNAELKLRFLIDFRLCPSCTDIALLDISNKLKDKYPYISQDALVVADDIRELKPIIKKFKNLDFYNDSTKMINEVYKIKSLPGMVLLDEENDILLSFENILVNKIEHIKIDSVIQKHIFTSLQENEDNLIMFAKSGSVNKNGSKISIFDYLNNRISIFSTENGKLINEIIMNDTIPLIFKNNFSGYEWKHFYSDNPNFAVKIQDCLFSEYDNIILTGFCIGDTKLDTLIEEKESSGLDTTLIYTGIPKNFYVNFDKNNKATIDSLSNTNYPQLKTYYYKSNTLIANVLPLNRQINNQDSIFMVKYINLMNKNEQVDINLRSLKNNNVNFRNPIEQILQAHSIYNFKNDLLVFLNTYNNIFFVKQKNKIREIEPRGILIDVFKKDQQFDSQSFLDSSRIQNFNKYFTHSITFDEDNNFYVILYNYKKEITADIAIQKYSIDNGFIKEVIIDLNSFEDEFSTIAPVTFNSSKILTKWKKARWQIMDLSKIIN